MCGIIGSTSIFDGLQWTKSQLSHLCHRGPDSQTVEVINNDVVMGATRLAMTDPHPRSNQPMVDRVSQNAISFNGEIYNYMELRASLANSGREFNTESDTEVLLQYLSIYGTENLDQINGMFAFVFYSNAKRKLYLSRDRLGKKPLYYSLDQENLRWSSSLETLRTKPNSISDDALIQYLSLGYIVDPTTTDTEVKSVRPGEIIEFDLDTRTLFKKRRGEESQVTDECVDDLRDVIGKSVSVRVSGHPKVAISLSGGVDSSIVAIEASDKAQNLKAFSAVWSDSDKDRYNEDARVARSLSKSLNIDFSEVEMVTRSEIPQELSRFLSAIEEPNNNPSGLSMMRLYSEIAKSDFRLALTGDGSDEIFGGYARHTQSTKFRNFLHLNGKQVNSSFFADRSYSHSKFHKVINTQVSELSPISWLRWHWVFTPNEISDLLNLTLGVQQYSSILSGVVERAVSPLPKEKSPSNLMKRDHEIWIPMESNRKLDRISMRYSIEARSPFQDDELVSWAKNYMKNSRYKNLEKKPLWTAYPELEALGVRKDKAGFTSPVGHWLRGNPDLIRTSLNYLKSDGRFSHSYLNEYSDAPSRGDYRELMQLWTLVVLATWLQMEC
jgi:asparagine synthase (glutamine-hydrolysing)